ncbi:unnamed protein product [Lota lota]
MQQSTLSTMKSSRSRSSIPCCHPRLRAESVWLDPLVRAPRPAYKPLSDSCCGHRTNLDTFGGKSAWKARQTVVGTGQETSGAGRPACPRSSVGTKRTGGLYWVESQEV